MTCEYCNERWKEGHRCLASELAHKLQECETQLAEAKEVLELVAECHVSYYEGPTAKDLDDRSTRPIKVERRDTIEAEKARALLEKWGKG